MPAFARTLLGSALLLVSLTADSRALVLDPMTTPLPPNPRLPVTQPRLLFVGTECDGVSCPPGSAVTQVNDETLQTGLSDVLGGNRRTMLHLQLANRIRAWIDPVARRATFEPGFDGLGELRLRYGTAGTLNADLLADGSTGLEFDLFSDANPPALLLLSCNVAISSRAFEADEATAGYGVVVRAPGNVRFPYSAFAGIDFRDVDFVTVAIYATYNPGNAFSIGPIETYYGATPAPSTTWGRLKTLYR